MTKEKMIRVPVLLGCCVPYAFLGMYMDMSHGNLLGYGLLLCTAVLFGWYGGKLNAVPAAMIGNAVSGVLSLVCLIWAGKQGAWNLYFNVFGTVGTCILLWLAAALVQLLFWQFYRKEKLVSYSLFAVTLLLLFGLFGGIQILYALDAFWLMISLT